MVRNICLAISLDVCVVVYRAEQVRPPGPLGDAEPVSAGPVLVARPEHQRREQPTVADSERKSRDCSERLVNKRGPTRHGRVSECVGGRWSAGGGQTDTCSLPPATATGVTAQAPPIPRNIYDVTAGTETLALLRACENCQHHDVLTGNCH